MGGCDLHDQLCSYYETHLRSRRWPIRIFTHCLMMAVVNSSIIRNMGLGPEMSLLDFQASLIESLSTATDESSSTTEDKEMKNEKFVRNVAPRVANVDNERRLDTSCRHQPGITSRENGNNRGVCMVCTKKSSTYCQSCKRFLYIRSNLFENCYDIFHTEIDFTGVAKARGMKR